MSKYLDLGGLEHLSDYLQTDDVTIERASNGSLKLSTGQTVWYGHRADWESLSPTEKAKYGIVIFDDDGTTITVDSALSTTSENPVQNKVITVELNKKVDTEDLAAVATSGSYNDLSNKPTIDSALSSTSTNAVQNKVIKGALDGKQDALTNPLTKSDVVNNLTTTTTNVPLSAAQGKNLNTNKQPKTLATPLTLGGVQYTTVESFLGAVKDIVQTTSYWNGGA